jgi:AcrR family transcriptional regulator
MSVRKAADRIEERSRRRGARREEKRRQIAESALEALMLYGCAGTTLRDIAERSGLSLGMLHYYFEDRRDLVVYCLRLYQDAFMERFEALVASAENRDDTVAALAEGLADAVLSEPVVNRFWYDIRTLSLFDPTVLPVVNGFQEALIAYARRVSSLIGFPEDEAEARFAMLEGVFRYHAQRAIIGCASDRETLRAAFRQVLTVKLDPAA